MNDLAISLISATNSQPEKLKVCQPKSLELWKKIHHVKSNDLLRKKTSCHYEIPETEEPLLTRKEGKEIEKELDQQGLYENRKTKKKLVRSMAHWQHLETKLEDFSKIYVKFKKVL